MRKKNAMKFTTLGYRGNIGDLDTEGQSLLWRAGDLRARFVLNDMAMAEYSSQNFDGSATLIHAERYLADRLAYELHPWPKGMVKDETINPLEEICSHCARLILEPNWCSVCKTAFCSLNCCLDHAHETVAGQAERGQ